MARNISPLDPDITTLDIDIAIAQYLGKGAVRSLKVDKFSAWAGKKSRKIAFNIVLQKDGADELQKHPIVLRVSSRDARQLSRALKAAADAADGIV